MSFASQNFFDLSTFPIDNLFQNTVWETLSQIDDVLKNPQGYKEISEGVFVGENVYIDPSARIEGRCIIGDNSRIEHLAYLRRGVIIGKNVRIGHAVEVKHSILLDDAAVAHLSYIGDSIVGRKVIVGGGAIFANTRADRQTIRIRHQESVYDTGFEKMGSIVGDNSFIGSNAVLNPGTVLTPESVVFPLVSVRGAYTEKKTFK